MNKMIIIIKDTYKRNVKSLSFLSMVFMPIVVLVAIVGFSYLITNSSNEKNIAIVSDDSQLITYLSDEAVDYKVDTSIIDETQAQEALTTGSISSFFVLNETGTGIEGRYITTTANDTLQSTIVDRIDLYNISKLSTENNISSEVIDAINQPSEIQTSVVYVKSGEILEESEQSSIKNFVSAAMCIMVFLFIMNYSVIIGQEIASEKGSRIMEVILSSTSATNHLIGKLVGVLLMCLTQLGLYLLLGIGVFLLLKDNFVIQSLLSGFSFDSELQKIIAVNLIFFVLSVIAFTLISAILASLVSRSEDTAKALQPLTLLGMGGFYLGIFLAQNNPENTIVRVLSYVPLLSNYTMPFRVASDAVSPFSVCVSIAAYVIFDLLLLKFAIRTYKINVLVYQQDFNLIKIISRSAMNLFVKKRELALSREK